MLEGLLDQIIPSWMGGNPTFRIYIGIRATNKREKEMNLSQLSTLDRVGKCEKSPEENESHSLPRIPEL